MDHPNTVAWDARMKAMFDRIDDILEDRYHNHWRIRHNRPNATDAQVPSGQQEEIEILVLDLLRFYIPQYFPERQLEVSHDGAHYQIHGDLSLGFI